MSNFSNKTMWWYWYYHTLHEHDDVTVPWKFLPYFLTFGSLNTVWTRQITHVIYRYIFIYTVGCKRKDSIDIYFIIAFPAYKCQIDFSPRFIYYHSSLITCLFWTENKPIILNNVRLLFESVWRIQLRHRLESRASLYF